MVLNDPELVDAFEGYLGLVSEKLKDHPEAYEHFKKTGTPPHSGFGARAIQDPKRQAAQSQKGGAHSHVGKDPVHVPPDMRANECHPLIAHEPPR